MFMMNKIMDNPFEKKQEKTAALELQIKKDQRKRQCRFKREKEDVSK